MSSQNSLSLNGEESTGFTRARVKSLNMPSTRCAARSLHNHVPSLHLYQHLRILLHVLCPFGLRGTGSSKARPPCCRFRHAGRSLVRTGRVTSEHLHHGVQTPAPTQKLRHPQRGETCPCCHTRAELLWLASSRLHCARSLRSTTSSPGCQPCVPAPPMLCAIDASLCTVHLCVAVQLYVAVQL